MDQSQPYPTLPTPLHSYHTSSSQPGQRHYPPPQNGPRPPPPPHHTSLHSGERCQQTSEETEPPQGSWTRRCLPLHTMVLCRSAAVSQCFTESRVIRVHFSHGSNLSLRAHGAGFREICMHTNPADRIESAVVHPPRLLVAL